MKAFILIRLQINEKNINKFNYLISSVSGILLYGRIATTLFLSLTGWNKSHNVFSLNENKVINYTLFTK